MFWFKLGCKKIFDVFDLNLKKVAYIFISLNCLFTWNVGCISLLVPFNIKLVVELWKSILPYLNMPAVDWKVPMGTNKWADPHQPPRSEKLDDKLAKSVKVRKEVREKRQNFDTESLSVELTKCFFSAWVTVVRQTWLRHILSIFTQLFF